MPVTVAKLVRFLDERFPFALAEEWDNVGLIAGDPRANVTRVLLAVDLTAETIEEAVECGCNAVVTHHPPIFRPIHRIDQSTTQGHVIGECLKHGVAAIALHTNLDSAQGGLNDCVCGLLGLTNVKPLVDSGKSRFLKLAVFTPKAGADKVRAALHDAGAGHVGNYDRCSFNTPGIGTFRGGQNTNPAIGTPGSYETVEEVKIEVILPRERWGNVYSAMLSAHPYEEVAYDLLPLENREKSTGLGRVGALPEAIPLRDFCDKLSALGMMVLRYIDTPGEPGRKVRKVALCTGAGSDFTSAAASAGADVYLTAEVKHHHALDAHRRGLAVVETDHYTLERVFWPSLKPVIEEAFAGQLTAQVTNRERNVWTRYP